MCDRVLKVTALICNACGNEHIQSSGGWWKWVSPHRNSAAWGVGKLDHPAYGYSVPTFQNSVLMRTCTHRCWTQLSTGTCDTQWHIKYKVAFNWTWLQSVATVLWLPQVTTHERTAEIRLLSRSSTVGAIIWHLNSSIEFEKYGCIRTTTSRG